MSTKTIELMKQVIEDKKAKNAKNNFSRTDTRTIGSKQKAFKNIKNGGTFDK